MMWKCDVCECQYFSLAKARKHVSKEHKRTDLEKVLSLVYGDEDYE